jgi:hypothetical protein
MVVSEMALHPAPGVRGIPARNEGDPLNLLGFGQDTAGRWQEEVKSYKKGRVFGKGCEAFLVVWGGNIRV